MTLECIIDFETLSIDETCCAVVNMSILKFDRVRFTSDEPYDFDLIDDVNFFKVNVKDQVDNYGSKVQQSTVEFWMGQPKVVRAKILPSNEDLTVVEFCQSVLDVAGTKKFDRWWARGQNFDPVILKRLMRDANLTERFESVFNYGSMRDTRTWIDAKFNDQYSTSFVPVEDKTKWDAWFKQHDSMYDVVADVLRLQRIARAEADLE